MVKTVNISNVKSLSKTLFWSSVKSLFTFKVIKVSNSHFKVNDVPSLEIMNNSILDYDIIKNYNFLFLAQNSHKLSIKI